MDSSTSLTNVVSILHKILQDPNLPSFDGSTQELTGTPADESGEFKSGISKDLNARPIIPGKIPQVDKFSLLNQSQPDTAEDEVNSLHNLTSHLTDKILPYLNRQSLSPHFYGFVTGGTTPAALLGDFLTSVYDQNVHVHLPNDTICTAVEVQALNALALDFFRLSPKEDWEIGGKGSGGGIFTTGATASNILGLALGREFVLREALKRRGKDDAAQSVGEYGLPEMMELAGVKRLQVLSTLPHSSVVKAAGVVGIGRRNVYSIAMEGDALQIDLEKLEMEAKKQDTLSILAISAGEVNTGRFATNSADQLRQIRKICSAHGIWIHVDGAFGLFGRLFSTDDPDYGDLAQGVAGIDLADSITGDCHKLLNVPYDCGIFFTRHKSLSEDVFRNGNAAYLTSGMGPDDGIQSPLNIGLENSRRFRALPVYATISAYGRHGYVGMLKRQIGLARKITQWLLKDERYEVLPGGANEDVILARTYIIVLFRAVNEDDNKSLVKRINQSRQIYVSGTVWDGQPAARIAISNWRVDVERDGDIIKGILDIC